jgi:hypothetical protein
MDVQGNTWYFFCCDFFLGSDYKPKQMILGYLKQQKLLVKPWLPTNIKELFGQYGLRKKNLHMWQMKGQI